MKADYDSEGDTIQIELESAGRLDYGEDVDGGAVVVGIYENRPVALDVIGTDRNFESSLRSAAERYELDAEALIAAAQAALVAPDRQVTLDIDARAAI